MSNGRLVQSFKRTIGLGLITSVLVTQLGCSSTVTDESPILAETITITESTETIDSSESSTIEESSEPEESTTSFTYETVEHSYPFSISGFSADQLNILARSVIYGPSGTSTDYGFDNPYSLEQLRNYAYECNGIYDDTITLTDVNYFIGCELFVVIADNSPFTTEFTQYELYPEYDIELVRAVLQIEGLRFGIDEIPYSYFERRFPQFVNEAFYEASFSDYVNLSSPLPSEICGFRLDVPTTYRYDMDLYTACLVYNWARSQYIYRSGNSAITQVRDELTGRNILVPTDYESEQMLADIHSLPNCENIDIYQVETREDFYNSYGCYPEDVLNDEYMYEPNRTAVAGQVD